MRILNIEVIGKKRLYLEELGGGNVEIVVSDLRPPKDKVSLSCTPHNETIAVIPKNRRNIIATFLAVNESPN